MPCTTYYCCHCTAARQIANAITEEANCSVMFPDWKKQTCIQRLNTQRHTHVYIHAVKLPRSLEMTDITTHQPPHPPPPLEALTHALTYTYSSHGIPASHQTVPCRLFMVDHSRVGEEIFLLEDKQQATCTPSWWSCNWAKLVAAQWWHESTNKKTRVPDHMVFRTWRSGDSDDWFQH